MDSTQIIATVALVFLGVLVFYGFVLLFVWDSFVSLLENLNNTLKWGTVALGCIGAFIGFVCLVVYLFHVAGGGA